MLHGKELAVDGVDCLSHVVCRVTVGFVYFFWLPPKAVSVVDCLRDVKC